MGRWRWRWEEEWKRRILGDRKDQRVWEGGISPKRCRRVIEEVWRWIQMEEGGRWGGPRGRVGGERGPREGGRWEGPRRRVGESWTLLATREMRLLMVSFGGKCRVDKEATWTVVTQKVSEHWDFFALFTKQAFHSLHCLLLRMLKTLRVERKLWLHSLPPAPLGHLLLVCCLLFVSCLLLADSLLLVCHLSLAACHLPLAACCNAATCHLLLCRCNSYLLRFFLQSYAIHFCTCLVEIHFCTCLVHHLKCTPPAAVLTGTLPPESVTHFSTWKWTYTWTNTCTCTCIV